MKPAITRVLGLSLAVATVPLMASCTDSAPGRNTATAVPLAKVTGPPQSCVPITQLRQSHVRDDSTIDFMEAVGKKGWRVSLPYPCPNLKAEDRFTYSTSLSELCSTDIITVLYQAPGLRRGASCGLGQFVPITLATK